jgi:hypothetical protein
MLAPGSDVRALAAPNIFLVCHTGYKIVILITFRVTFQKNSVKEILSFCRPTNMHHFIPVGICMFHYTYDFFSKYEEPYEISPL